ncbi:MAG TPA: sugar ABC transporter ATP-binding protein, partial [Jiangellales bacterium]|nr:sugar ABC transporter ATP-binding protein [Jiangellales bacterium]
LGSDAFIYGDLARPQGDVTERLASEQIIARVEPRLAPHKGDQVWLRIRPEQEHVFSVKSGERLTA